MSGYCYQWAFNYIFNFMWHNNEVDCSRYQLCVGIVRDPKSGRRYDHVWIEDAKTGLVLNKYKFKKKVEHASVEDYYSLMHPAYIKKYSGREMLKKVLKTGIYGLLTNVPSTVLKASDFKSHKDNRKHSRKPQKT
jgi:hypothetical protein